MIEKTLRECLDEEFLNILSKKNNSSQTEKSINVNAYLSLIQNEYPYITPVNNKILADSIFNIKIYISMCILDEYYGEKSSIVYFDKYKEFVVIYNNKDRNELLELKNDDAEVFINETYDDLYKTYQFQKKSSKELLKLKELIGIFNSY